MTLLTGFVWASAQAGGQSAKPMPRSDAGQLWLVPEGAAGQSALAKAVDELADGRAAAALPTFAKSATDPQLGGYALLYMGRAQFALKRFEDAAFTARQLAGTNPAGYLREAAWWLAADAAEGASDWPGAVKALQALLDGPSLRPQEAWVRLGRAALNVQDRDLALRALTTVYYKYPLSTEAADAAVGLHQLTPPAGIPGAATLPQDLDRAQRLLGARRYAEARTAYAALEPLVTDQDRDLVALRLAECDFYLRRYATARAALQKMADRPSPRRTEAQFYYLSTVRELKKFDEYRARARTFVDDHPTDPLAETTLDDLGTHYILENDDASAAAVFAELYRRYPQGAHADRAAWKAGWWAYKNGDYAAAIRTFESAAAAFPHADYRPSWLYWAARAHARAGERDLAVAGYQRVVADYRNSYYGREAGRQLSGLAAAWQPAGTGTVLSAANRRLPGLDPGLPPPTAAMIRSLLRAGLYDDAVREVQSAQRTFGNSPLLDATLAYALNQRGDLRPAISAMRRAYPEFMAEGGEALPPDLLAVIFPLAHWRLLNKYATAHKLDPYLVAALVAQESTFQADIRSAANAYGLMQIVPSTGRRYAARLGIRPFRTSKLTDPEANIRIGTAYFADLLKQFGDLASALAAYNAGEQRVSRWLAERPGVDRDEFIDDIPFPETQNYVKRILGTADDYRFLYRDLKLAPVGN